MRNRIINRLRLLAFLLSFLSFLSGGFAQESNSAKAKKMCDDAIGMMDAGNVDASIKLLNEAQKLDGLNAVIPYEIAYAYYLKEDYNKVISILDTLVSHKDANDRFYQLLGNAYDYIGKPESGLEVYTKGIKRFPNSGKLYLESGQIKFSQESYQEAINLWEKGCKVEPNFSSNYYWLAKIYNYTDERIWSIFYSEYFLLLEPGSKRTEEIGKLLFDNYRKSYTATSDTSGSFNLTKKGFEIVIEDKKDLKKGILPFEGTYASCFAVSAINFQSIINLKTIAEARGRFLNCWFNDKKFLNTYPNSLLSYQKKIEDAGLFEVYTYWLLFYGDKETAISYFEKNDGQLEKLIKWLNENDLELKAKDKAIAIDYKK